MEQLYSLIGADMKAVDAVIRQRLHSEVALVRQVAEYIVQSGGKRLRPALVLLSAGALGYRGSHHHELAAVIEFIHTATLLHDDVVDGSDLRRGRETANALFGNSASVLVGDFLYSRAFQMMVAVDDMRIMRVLSDATNVIAEGEVLQLMNCHDAGIDEAAICRSFATRPPSCSRRRRNWVRSSVAVTPRSRRRWPFTASTWVPRFS
jgi:octaprenyl-diphosphate synthase